MGFVDFSGNFDAAQWVQNSQSSALTALRHLFWTTRLTYQGVWTDPIDRIAALGTGAATAFQAHAASVQYLLTVLPLFDGTADMIAEAKGWQIPIGWIISFNPDGSANVTPPQSSTGA